MSTGDHIFVARQDARIDELEERLAEAQKQLDAWIDFARRLRLSHRAQLPSGTFDLYNGGCGCPQCEEAARLMRGAA